MEVSKKPPCNDKKMVVKMGTGGIGTVILFGGALATAAFASAFLVGLKKRRSSVVNRRDEPAKKIGVPEEDVHEFVSVDNVSSVAISKEVESDMALMGDAQSLELDEKKDIGNDGNRVEQSGDGEMKAMDHIQAVEVTAVRNRIGVGKTLDEMHNDEKEAEKNSERKTDIESQLNGETEEVKIEGVENTKRDFVANRKTDQDEGEATKVDDGDIERVNVDTMEVEGSPSKEVNYYDAEPLVIESPVTEHINADGGVKVEVLTNGMEDVSVGVNSESQQLTDNDVTEGVTGVMEKHAGEVIQENGVAEWIREDEVKHVVEEELMGKVQKEIHQFDAEQSNEELSNAEHEKSEEVNEEKSNNVDEPENQELGECKRIVENVPALEKEMISIDAEENTVNEADLSVTTNADTEKTSIDLIIETNEMEKGETEAIVDYDEMELSDEVEDSSVGTGESSTDSNSEAVWPAEESSETQQVNLINQEVAGKALEDKKPGAATDFNDREINSDKAPLRASIMDYSIYRNTVKKYLDEFQMVKDQPENAIKKVMLIVILSMFASYSCSRLFGCSFVKLSLIMFFSIVLLKIHAN